MKLPKLSVNKPVTTAMVFMAILLFGLVSLKMLPLDVMPAMELPSLTVLTVYPGASANEVEDQVSRVLEAQLSGVQDLKSIKSSSRENVSIVSLEFNWGSDIATAANNTRDMMEMIKSHLPENAKEPIIYKVNSSMMPVLIYSITATENYNGLSQIIEDEIASPLKKVEGVGSVIYLGQPEREIRINVNPAQLKAYNLSIAGLSAILKAENVSIPGGSIKVGTNDFSVRIPAEITSAEELAEIPIKNFLGKLVRLSDVATIEDGYLETDEFARTQSGHGAVIMIQKQSGKNSLDVVKAVRSRMKELAPNLANDIKVGEILSQEEVITQSIKSLSDTLWWALLFVALVVVAFLRDWKSSLIILLTIPFSLITAFIFMYANDWTINIFSLMSLIIAIGMVVDDAIVVLENITQHIAKGERPREAAIFATSEMGLAVVASTTTVLVVFIPLIFVGGVVGIFFKQLAALTAVTLIASLIAALTLSPMIASRLLKKTKTTDGNTWKDRLFKSSEKNIVMAENMYKRLLGWAVYHKSFVVISAILILIASLFGARKIGSDYLPIFDAGDVIVIFQTPVGTSASETDRVAQQVIDLMKENVPELVPGTLGAISGQTRDGLLSTVGFSEGKNIGTVLCHLTLPDKRERKASEIGDVLRAKVAEIPEIEKFHVTSGNILESAILGNEKPVEVKVSGKDLDLLTQTANQIKFNLETITGLIDIESSADKGKQDYEIIIDRKKASSVGLNSGLIALQIRQSIYGAEAGSISEGGEDYDIMIRYSPENRSDIPSIGNITLTTLLGTQIRLSDIAEVRQGYGPMEIKRESQQRYITVSADIRGLSLGNATEKVNKAISTIEVPQGVSVKLAGQTASQNESFGDLSLVLIIGVILVYMVMAAQFESFKHPFIIMLAVPFTLVGIVVAFLLTGTTLSVTTFIGIIMLVGIVVKNGIILVDYINMLRKRGYKLYDAIQEGGRSRLRPVVMTSSTMILAMVPMALSNGMGYEMFSPLAVTMIGGLLFSMIITLIIVPVFYAIFNKDK
ncbi:MAG: efflux RND transporter permease subunit [Bacteroidales bacterium]|nr:efflux RND transporter permease subunit [Bacteroidales bacterium]